MKGLITQSLNEDEELKDEKEKVIKNEEKALGWAKFFSAPIELYREQILKKDKICLLGVHYGSFITGHYTRLHPEHVESLIFVSPHAFTT
jgi:hypothetical protein